MPGLRTLALTVAVRGGARWEDEGRSGWSHCLEHLVFKGAGDMGAREIVERIEAQGGSLNAATGYERTSFEVRGLEGSLPVSMQVLSDLVFRPTLDPAEIEREKDVVAQEIAEAFDTPDDHVFEMAQARAFEGQPLGRPILGSVESLKPINRATISDWRARLYSPDRMVVSASGAVDQAELLELAGRWFGGEASAPAEAPAVPRFTGGDAALTRRIEQANLVFLLPAPSAVDPGFAAARLMTEILGGGMASRLFQEAREKRGLAYAIDAYSETYADTGVLGVFAGCAAKDAEELAKVTAGEIVAMTKPVDEAELARAKAQLKGAMFMARESPLARAEQAAGQVLLFGRTLTPESVAAEVDRITPQDLARLTERILASRRAAVAVLGPRASLAAVEAFEAALFG